MAKHIFIGKSVVLHPREGPELRTHYCWDREEKKSQAPGGIQTLDLSLHTCIVNNYHLAHDIDPLKQPNVVMSKLEQRLRVRKNSLALGFEPATS